MSLATIWGYNLTEDATTFADLLTESEFDELTAGKYTGDRRPAAEIKAASDAIRNYCGWHLYPEAACSLSERLLHGDGRAKRVGRDLMIQLPARFVTAVSSVLIDDVAYTDFDFERDGILHIFDVPALSRKSLVVVNYTAGIPAALMGSVKELAAHRVTHALASSNGVTSEAAGGVSITYNAAWVNSARASALPDDDKEVLAPFKVQGVF